MGSKLSTNFAAKRIGSVGTSPLASVRANSNKCAAMKIAHSSHASIKLTRTFILYPDRRP
jgi:hypothetical protein